MQRKRKIPNNPDFRGSTRRGYELLIQSDIKELPVDPFKIVEINSEHWHLLSWSELKHNTGVEDPYNLKRDKAEAKTLIIRGTKEYTIIYDDSFNRERVRWTIAHEIGHILLGHLIYYNETALNRGGLTKKQYGVLEVEAHYFAEALLAPNYLLHLFDIKDSQEIAFLCDISKDAATKCEKHLENYYQNDHTVELALFRNLYEFFYRDKFLQSTVDGINRFYGSYLYDDFYKHCRICRNCNAYIVNSKQKYCHNCGNEIAEWGFPFEQLPTNGLFRGFPKYLEGKFYPPIELGDNNKVLYCPVCKNHIFSKDALHCKICGTTLQNTCKNENTILSGECRYCPDCGGISEFEELSLFDTLKEIEIPELLTFDNGSLEDYIEYEYWDCIIAATYYFEKDLELYSALSLTKAIRDDGSFIIFVPDDMTETIILEHEETLIKCIKKYGQTLITNVRCLHDL